MTIPNNILYLGDKLMTNKNTTEVNYQDAFEDLYLKHDYLKRVKDFDQNELKEHEVTVKVTAKIMYDKFKITYNKVGFYYDDIVNISRVYLYAYLGIYSFKTNPDKYEKYKLGFVKTKGRDPSIEEMTIGERNIIINFIRQKLTTCSTFCERKSRNIVVGKNEKKAFAFTEFSIPASNDLILEHPKTFGYRSLHKVEMELIKKNNLNKKNGLFDKDGFKVFEIEQLSQLPVSFQIYVSSGDSDDDEAVDLLNLSSVPSVEDTILDIEEDKDLDVNMINFESLETSKRKLMLTNFIRKNSDSKYLKEELYTAKKMLKNMKAMV